MFEGSSRREVRSKLAALAAGILVIVIATSAAVHGLATGRNQVTSIVGLVFAAGMTSLIAYVVWRWAFPSRRRGD